MLITLQPSEIYFTQASIRRTFRFSSQTIYETRDAISENRISVDSIPTIKVIKKSGKYWTLDNRRLWVFRELDLLGKLPNVTVEEVTYVPETEWNMKYNTQNGGTSVTFH